MTSKKEKDLRNVDDFKFNTFQKGNMTSKLNTTKKLKTLKENDDPNKNGNPKNEDDLERKSEWRLMLLMAPWGRRGAKILGSDMKKQSMFQNMWDISI